MVDDGSPVPSVARIVLRSRGWYETWPEAGMYWLETGTEDNKTSVKQAAKRRLSYVATLEVLPQ